MCDHIIAHGYEDKYGGFISESRMQKECRDIISELKEWANSPPCNFFKKAVLKYTTEYQYLDRQLTLFKFCPSCGLKINWAKYKKEITCKNS